MLGVLGAKGEEGSGVLCPKIFPNVQTLSFEVFKLLISVLVRQLEALKRLGGTFPPLCLNILKVSIIILSMLLGVGCAIM